MSADHNAGVPEYWLIDARSGQVRFDILSRGPKGYRESRMAGGWVKSKLFARSIRLIQAKGRHGIPDYTLEVR
jgi:Uma2 family endonuclease